MESPFRFRSDPTETTLRRVLVETGRIAYDRGLLSSNEGNLSTRLGTDRVLITPSGLGKGRMGPQDMLIVDLAGNPVDNPTGRPTVISSEAAMHLEVYRQRPDVRAVLHAHPPYCVALTVAGIELNADAVPEVLATLGSVPTVDFAMPASDEGAAAIRGPIQDHDVLLLRLHGVLAVGPDLETALLHMERVEQAAQVIALATMLGKVNTVPPEAKARLLAMYTASRS